MGEEYCWGEREDRIEMRKRELSLIRVLPLMSSFQVTITLNFSVLLLQNETV